VIRVSIHSLQTSLCVTRLLRESIRNRVPRLTEHFLARGRQLTTTPHPVPTPDTIRLRQTTGDGGQSATLAPTSPSGGGEAGSHCSLRRASPHRGRGRPRVLATAGGPGEGPFDLRACFECGNIRQPVGHASPTTGFLGNCRARTPSGLRAVRRGGLLKQALRPDGSTLVAWLKMRRVSDTADKQRVFL